MHRESMFSALMSLCLTTACAAKGTSDLQQALDPKIQLFGAAKGEMLLRQCSRSTPEKGESYFRPNAKDIIAFELALQKALDLNPQYKSENDWRKSHGHPERSLVGKDWARDIVGMVKNGKSYLYGNYYPAEDGKRGFKNEPVIICDGGPSFFGAEFDIEQGRISHLAFNGMI
jgi:hypothetical protein